LGSGLREGRGKKSSLGKYKKNFKMGLWAGLNRSALFVYTKSPTILELIFLLKVVFYE
jgi:hypothetical protein